MPAASEFFPMTQADAASQTAPATFPPVEEYRQILLWPLALHTATVRGEGGVAELVQRQIGELVAMEGKPWTRLKDPLRHVPRELGEPVEGPRQEPYAEFVYFHDFVQQFLYPRASDHNAGKTALQIFNRSDIGFVRIVAEDRTFLLRVDRCNLYLFRMGVAIFAVEVTTEGTETKLDLRDAILLEDIFRRVYTPYFMFDAKTGTYTPGQVPTQVEWLAADASTVIGSGGPHDVKSASEIIDSKREPPVFEHWKSILGLTVRGIAGAPPSETAIEWRHVVDERMPFMTYIRLPASHPITSIERGDWMRLCFADPPRPGTVPGSLPYDPGFLASFEAEHCYDRFKSMGTRQMFAGFSYVIVGSSSTDPNDDIFRDTLRHHFRHMYFQMALIAHLEFATCLTFSSRLSAATAEGGIRGPEFASRLIKIHEEFKEFVHLFRFTGISNQMQAREMFALWRKHLGLDPLLADVKEELEAATSHHFAREAKTLADQAARQADATIRLNVIAILGLGAGLAFSFLGMNVIWTEATLQGISGETSPWLRLAVLGLAITSAVLAISTLGTDFLATRLFGERRVPATEPHTLVRRIMRGALLVFAFVFVMSLVFYFSLPPK